MYSIQRWCFAWANQNEMIVSIINSLAFFRKYKTKNEMVPKQGSNRIYNPCINIFSYQTDTLLECSTLYISEYTIFIYILMVMYVCIAYAVGSWIYYFSQFKWLVCIENLQHLYCPECLTSVENVTLKWVKCMCIWYLSVPQSVEYYFNGWSSSTIFTFDLEFVLSSFDWIQKGLFSLPFRLDVYHISNISIRLTHIRWVDNDNEDERRQALKYRHLPQRRKTIQ